MLQWGEWILNICLWTWLLCGICKTNMMMNKVCSKERKGRGKTVWRQKGWTIHDNPHVFRMQFNRASSWLASPSSSSLTLPWYMNLVMNWPFWCLADSLLKSPATVFPWPSRLNRTAVNKAANKGDIFNTRLFEGRLINVSKRIQWATKTEVIQIRQVDHTHLGLNEKSTISGCQIKTLLYVFTLFPFLTFALQRIPIVYSEYSVYQCWGKIKNKNKRSKFDSARKRQFILKILFSGYVYLVGPLTSLPLAVLV